LKRKLLSTKFGERLIFMWRFIETNAAAMGTLNDCAAPPSSVVCRQSPGRKAFISPSACYVLAQ
jgi:hypothetical protein